MKHHNPKQPHSHYPQPVYPPPYMMEDDDEIDLMEIAAKIWKGRRLIIITTGIFILLGLFVALGSAEEYESQVRLMPETRQPTMSGGLGGLARQFGISGGSQQQGEGIPPALYPEITRSTVLMQQLLQYDVDLPEGDGQVTLFDYFTEHRSPSAVSIAQRYTIGLPFTILGGVRSLFSSDEEAAAGGPSDIDYEIAGDRKIERILRLNRQEWEVIEALRDRISTGLDQENGMVSVSVKLPDPDMAADVADQVVQFLIGYITENRTEKARQDAEFIEQRYEESLERFEEAQEALARFRDQNRGDLTALARTREQRLQSEYDLTFNLYNTMAERREEARIKLQEDTPVVNVIEPAAVPDRRSEPRRGMLMVIYTLLGGILGTGLIFLQSLWVSFQDKKEMYFEEV